jgi:hypothetical protein
MSKNENTTVVTPTGQLAFEKYLFEAEEKKNGPKFSASLILTKDQDVAAIKAEMMRAIKASKLTKEDIEDEDFSWGVKKPKKKAIKKYDFMTEDTIVLNASTKFDVAVKAKDGVSDLVEGDVKAGDFCRFLVSAYTWSFQGKNGVSLNLIGVQKIKTGDAFYSSRDVSNDFAGAAFDVAADEDAKTEVASDDMGW